MWIKELKRSFILPLAIARNMICDFLRKVGYDGQKIVVELPTVDIQVYKNFKATQNYQRGLPQKAIKNRAIAAESRNFLRECIKRKCDR